MLAAPLASGPVCTTLPRLRAAPGPLAALDGGNHVGFIGIGVDGPRNADAIVGCPVIGAGGRSSRPAEPKLAEKIEEGAGPAQWDLESCGRGSATSCRRR